MNLTEHDLRVALRCASELLDGRRLRGVPIPGWLVEHYRRVDATYRTAATAASGTEDAASSAQSEDDEIIGTIEAAEILELSTRRVRDIARDLDGIKVGRDWTFRRDAVEQYAHGKGQQWVTRSTPNY